MAEIYVTSTADSGAGSLRQAIADAQDGDVILFDSDVFPVGQTTAILLSSSLSSSHDVLICGGFSDGQGGYTSGITKLFYVYRDVDGIKTKTYVDDDKPAQEWETVLFENVCRIALDGQNTTRFFYTNSGTKTYRGIQFRNGYNSTYGGCFSTTNDATLNLFDCSFNDCSAHDGAVLYATSTSHCTMIDCSIENCNATTLGGVIYAVASSNNTITRCSIDSCSAGNGGVFYSHQTTVNTLNDCVIYGCSATTNGGVVYSASTSQNTLNDCTITNCSATYGGGVYSANTSQNTLNDCTITNCSATTSNGGGVYSTNTSQNTLNDCTITNCSASNYGGGVCSASTSQNTLNDCTITNCSASNYGGGGVYSASTSQNTLNDCTISGNTSEQDVTKRDAIIGEASVAIINGSKFGALRIGTNAQATVQSGITTVDTLTLLNSGGVYPTITINDGAALTITDSATIGSAKFTSDGRGYLAVGAGIDTSAATLTNVVLCAYGADVSNFAEVDGVLEWSAANPTTTVLIERADSDSWATVTQTAGESLTLYLPPSDTVRLFDGVQFFTAQAPSQRTYYYIGGSEGSFTSAADWSLRRGGVAITEPPVVAGQKFIVGDISSGE